MAITLMTTTGTQKDVNAALGLPPEPADQTPPVEPPAGFEGTVEELTTPPVVVAPAEPVVPVADEVVPDSEFDEDGEPTTERAARSPHTKLQTIKKLRVRAREAEQKAARLEGENAVLRSNPTGAHPPGAPPPQAVVTVGSPKPTPEDINPTTGELLFTTNEEFIEALVDWKQAQRDAIAEQRAAGRQIAERQKAFVADHPDFPDLLKNPALQINDAQSQVLNDPDNTDAPAMVYALAKDPALCESIRVMPYHRALMAMGKLQASLAAGTPAPPAPSRVPVPSAPPPPIPVRGTTAPSTVSLDQLAKAGDIQGFNAARNAEDARKRLAR
jgi:hypothetical protein